MAKYVDGFVLVVPGDKVDDYRKMAEEGKEAWMRNGALAYYECIGDDLVTRDMGGNKAIEFTELIKAGRGDTVWLSFIVFESREHRDEVNRKVIAEMDEKFKDKKDVQMPVDMKRFAYGGFEVIVEAAMKGVMA